MEDLDSLDGFESRLEEIEGMSPEAVEAAKKAAEAEAARGTEKEQAKAWAVIPEMVGGFVCMIAPELAMFYTEDKCLTWGERMVPVAKKRGWDAGPDALPEIALIASTFSMAFPTFICLRKKITQARAQAAATQAQVDADRTVDNGAAP